MTATTKLNLPQCRAQHAVEVTLAKIAEPAKLRGSLLGVTFTETAKSDGEITVRVSFKHGIDLKNSVTGTAITKLGWDKKECVVVDVALKFKGENQTHNYRVWFGDVTVKAWRSDPD